jgi:hypothetical protein
MKKILLFILPLLFCACSVKYNIQQNQALSQNFLIPNKKVYVALPANGKFNNIIYQTSAASVQYDLSQALEQHTLEITLASTYEPIENAIESGLAKQATYLFYPTITHWEERNTPWSGISDRVSIKMVVINLENNETLISTYLSAKSPWGALVNNQPDAMLPDLFKSFTNSIYKR